MVENFTGLAIAAAIGALIGGAVRPPVERGINYLIDQSIAAFKPENLSDTELKKATEEVYQDIMSFCRERKTTEPDIPFHYSDDNEDFGKNRDEWLRETTRHSRTTTGLYQEKFGPRVQDLINEYRKRGIDVDSVTSYHQHPTNPLGVEAVANDLLALTENLD